MRLGDCPTFFPRPALTPGSEAHFESLSDEERDALPNWVHKAGSGNDQVQVGSWTDGKPGTPPNGTGATPGTWEQKGGSTPLDNGKTHGELSVSLTGQDRLDDAISRRCVSSRVWLFNFANHAVFVFICAASKDFYDPTTGRRIMWVWGTLPNGIQTIPREMTYDPRTNKISACITIASMSFAANAQHSQSRCCELAGTRRLRSSSGDEAAAEQAADRCPECRGRCSRKIPRAKSVERLRHRTNLREAGAVLLHCVCTVFTCVACRNTSLAEGYSCIYMYIMRVGQICHIQHQFCWRNAVLQLHHRGGNCSSWLRHAGRKRSRSGHPCGRAPRHPSRSRRPFHQPGHWSWPKAQLDHNDGRR